MKANASAESETASPKAGRGLIFLLIAGTSLGPLTVNILMPAMPRLVADFHTEVEIVQLTLSLFLVGLAVSQLALGPLSDHFGRRPVMIAGFALTTIASLAAVAATTISWVIVARVLQAFGASTGLVIGRAIIRDVYDRDQSASMIGWVTMAMLVVPMLAPTIGGILDSLFGWESIFLFVGLFAAVLMTWTLLTLEETRSAALSGGGVPLFLKGASDLVSDRNFLGYTLAGAFGSATFFSFLGAAPHVVVTMMGHTSVEYGFWFAANAVCYAFGNFVTARWSVRVGSRRLALLGTLGAVIGVFFVIAAVLLLPLSVGPALIFVPQMIVSINHGLMLPNLIAGAVSAKPEAAGAAAGIAGFVQMGLSGAMAQLAAHALSHAETPLPMALVSAGCAIAALVFYVFLVRPEGRNEV